MIASLFKKLINIVSRNNNLNKRNSTSTANRELYVGNIEYRTKTHELRKVFERYGDIESLKIIRDPRTKKSKGYGFVKFYKQNAAQSAVKQQSARYLRGRELKVAYAKEN